MRPKSIASRVKEVYEMGVEVAVVIGAGNLWRGKQGLERGMDRATADYMGMLGTVMNAMALMDALERAGVYHASPCLRLRCAQLLSLISAAAPSVISKRDAWSSLAPGRAIRYFSTDTAAALRAMEIGAEVVIKATKVDGIYDSDPKKNPDATEVQADDSYRISQPPHRRDG